jgi:hypothetical protein
MRSRKISKAAIIDPGWMANCSTGNSDQRCMPKTASTEYLAEIPKDSGSSEISSAVLYSSNAISGRAWIRCRHSVISRWELGIRSMIGITLSRLQVRVAWLRKHYYLNTIRRASSQRDRRSASKPPVGSR